MNPEPIPPRPIRARLRLVTPWGEPIPGQSFVLNGKAVRADERGEFFYKDTQRAWYPHVLSRYRSLILRVDELAPEKDYKIVVGRRRETGRLEGMLLRTGRERVRWARVVLHRLGAQKGEPVARPVTDWGGRFVAVALVPGRYRLAVISGKNRAGVFLPETLTLRAGGAVGRRFTLSG